jgi:hypothetical protein
MQSYKHIAILCLVFFNFTCNEELKTSFTETKITTSTNKLVEINIPNAIDNNLVSNEINTEISYSIIAALQIGESDTITTKTIEESIDAFNEEYNAFNADFPNSALVWEAQIDGEVMFQSPKIISIAITSYVNTGGAHGNTTISFLNFDAVTGKRILNKNLIKNEAAFKEAAKPYFEATIKEEDVLFDSDNFQLPANIGYNEEGIVLLYNTYEIAPYSTGIIEFTIPMNEVSSYLTFEGS